MNFSWTISLADGMRTIIRIFSSPMPTVYLNVCFGCCTRASDVAAVGWRRTVRPNPGTALALRPAIILLHKYEYSNSKNVQHRIKIL